MVVICDMNCDMNIYLVGSSVMPHSHCKPASTKPRYRIGPSDWSVHQIQSFDWLKFKLVQVKLCQCECNISLLQSKTYVLKSDEKSV